MKKFLSIYLNNNYILIHKILFAIGVILFFSHISFHLVLKYIFGYYDSPVIRLLIILLSLGLLYIYRQKTVTIFQQWYYSIVMSITLPLQFNLMLILNDFNTYWYASMYFGAYIFGALIKPLKAMLLWPLSYAASLLILKYLYQFDLSPEVINATLSINFVAYFLVFIIGIFQVIIDYAFMEIRALNREKEKIYSIIAHDLRNLFTSITMSAGLLEEKARVQSSKEVSGMANQVNNLLDQACKLLENLLEWSSLKVGMHQPNYELFKPSKLLNDLLEKSRPIAMTKEIKLTANINYRDEIYADYQMLTTVLRNLINNALKFTQRGGMITLKLDKLENDILFTISDNGVGIKAENIEKLFLAGSKTSSSGTEKERGTGFGLMLSKEFVELHNGKIWAESQCDGGSDFKFTIPLLTKKNIRQTAVINHNRFA